MSKKSSPGNTTQGKTSGIISAEDFISGNPERIYDFGSKKLNFNLLLSGLLLAILVLFTFRNSFDNNFVDWDDFTYVINNDLVRQPGSSHLKDIFDTPVSSNYHPLTILSMRMNSNVCKTCPNGISAAPFIRWNVILHLLNTVLVLILVYLLSNRKLAVSFLVAALFGLHPMHVESVAWISERKDVLYSFFFLSGLIAYIYYKKESGRKHIWLVLSFVLFTLSCLSKATAVVFPLIMVLLNFWFSGYIDKESVGGSIRKSFSKKNMFILIPFLAVSFVVGMLAYRLQSGHNFLGILDLSKVTPDVVNKIGPFTLWHRIQIGCYGFITYIVKFFIPGHLSSFYPYPGLREFDNQALSTLIKFSPLAVIILMIPAIFSLKNTKLYFFGVAFYLLTIVLVLQFVSVGYAIIADRYSYLPYIGLSFIVAVFIVRITQSQKYLFYSISAGIIILMIVLSGKRIGVWRSTETLWSNVIDNYPHVEIARRSRGKYYSKIALQSKNPNLKKQFEQKALADFTEAIRSGSKNAEVYEGAGVIYGSKGEYKNAILCLSTAVAIDPKNGAVYYNRALTYGKMNLNDEAIRDYNMALIYSPQKAVEILTNRSNLFLITGRLKEAVADLDFLISADQRNFLSYYNRAVARQQLNDISGAISDYQKALQIQPADQMTRLQLQKLTATKNK